MSEALVESRSVYVEVILSSWCLDVGLEDNTASCSIKNNLDANCNSSNTTNLGLKDSISYTVSPLYKLFLNVYDWSNIKIGKYNSNGKKVGDKLKVFTGLNCESQEGMKI